MDKNITNESVPYVVYEDSMARMERTIEKLWILCITLLVLFIGSNLAWIYYESQFEDVVVTNEVDTGIGDATVTGVGDIINGESESKETD